MKALLSTTLAALATLAVSATYDFKVEGDHGVVTITIDKPAAEFRMPSWIPGDYALVHAGTFISDVRFTRGGREVPSLQGGDPDLWQIDGGATTVTYRVKQSRGNFSPNLAIREGSHVFINGGGVFGYFTGHTDESQTVTLPMLAQTAIREGDVYRARSYDELIDSPIVFGPSVSTVSQTLSGKPHVVVAFDQAAGFDKEGFLKLGLSVADECRKLFGELPYRHYYWFYDVNGGGGGLEHSEGARLGTWPKATPKDSAGFVFHEFFHTFNVKRIRAKVLGPFDYTKPAMTTSIWWLEGVTDYYADVLVARVGIRTREETLNGLNSNVRACDGGAYLKVSAADSSLRVWETRSSSGFGGVNYYTKGSAIGLLLDLAIRGNTQGKKSLDDVMRLLYKETKPPKPGFADKRLRELCVEVGGKEIGPIFDQAVDTAEPLPWDQVLPKVGWERVNGRIIPNQSAPEPVRIVGDRWPMSANAQ